MTTTPDADDADRSAPPRAGESGDTDHDTDVSLSDRLRGFSTTPRCVAGIIALVVVFALVATGPAVAGLPVTDYAPSTDSLGTNAVSAVPATEVDPTSRPELSGSFSSSTYTAIAGDPVEIRAIGDNTDGSAYLLIGGNRLTDEGKLVGYTDVVKLDEFDDTINTRLIGTDEGVEGSCSRDDVSCDDLKFRDEDGEPTNMTLDDVSGATGAGGLARPLVPQRYRLAVTNGTFVVEDSGAVTPVETAASADLLLTKPEFHDEIEVYTAPDPNDVEGGGGDSESLSALEQNGLDRTAVTKGDRVVFGFESTGIWGALSHFAAQRDQEPPQAGQEVDYTVLRDLLEAEEGVSLQVRQTNPGMNEPRSKLDPSEVDADDVSLFVADAEELETGDSTPGRFYLALNTSDGGPFTEDPEPGDEFAVEFALEGVEGERYAFNDSADEPPPAFEPEPDAPEQFPYWETADGTASAEASFTIQERYFEYDHVSDDGELLVEASGGDVTGTTTTLPPIEMSATFVDDTRDEPFRSESEVDLSDGNFSIGADLGGADPGTRLNYELYEGTTLRDSRTVVVVDDADDPNRLAIESAPENVTVEEDGNLSALGIDVRNAGGLEGDGTLALDVDGGNLTTERELTLSSNESRTVGFPSETVRLDPGTYPFNVTLDGDRHNGTLVVSTDPARTTIDDDDGEDDGADTDDSENSSNASDTDANSTDTDGNATESDSSDATSADGNSSESDGNSSESDGNSSESDGNSSESDGNSSAPADDSGGRDAGAPTTFLPFGIGTREAFGGTVLVGAVHLLGHWV